VVITGAALGEPLPLPVSRPETPKPVHEGDEPPSARIELHELALEVTSTPWMEVLIDGRSVGNTPRRGLQLTPGEHDVELLNRDLGLETHAYVHAERGSVETQEIAFE
jgi:serine/threonine-protein kinase